MNYIIFDLEWNCVRDEQTEKHINEIIEIGAVMLNDSFKEISSFSSVVNPRHGVQLNRYVKKLTHITEQELSEASDFRTVIGSFKRWCSSHGKDNVFCTWSNTDLFVLVENYAASLNKKTVDLIDKYIDMQKYVMRFVQKDTKNQIALSDAAELLGIDFDESVLHRATDDSRLCARILQKTYDKASFERQVQCVDRGSFYKRLMFKPYYITNINSPLIDKEELRLNCPYCKKPAVRSSAFRCKYKAFSANYRCGECDRRFTMSVRFKKTFDAVLVNRKISEEDLSQKAKI